MIEIPEQFKGLIDTINNIVGFMAPVVNAIVVFMLPLLLPMGIALRNFVLLCLSYISIGNYTWFIVVTAVTVAVTVTLTIIFAGEKPEND